MTRHERTGRASAVRKIGLNMLWLEITRKCNLACIHCYADSSPRLPLREGMSDKDWIDLLAQARNAGCQSVQFIGGEPTLHPGLPTFVSVAYALGYRQIEVFTNATVLRPGLIECFRQYGVRVATSFYTPDASVHEQITTQAGSHERTIAGIEAVLAAGLPLRVEIITMGPNDDHLEQTREFLRSLGVERMSHDRLRSVGRGLAQTARTTMADLCGQCWKGRLCVTATGEAFPCIMSRPWPVGNYLQGGLAGLLGAESLQQFREELRQAREPRASSECAPDTCAPDLQRCGPDSPSDPPEPCGPLITVNPDESFCAPSLTADARGPDNCSPNDGACGPDNCSPNDGACGPDNCAPNDAACGPDNCAPNDAACGPDNVGNACGPDNCAPNDGACGPDNCAPNDGACGPDNCAPNDGACGPDNTGNACGPDNCAPNDGACGPDNCAPNDGTCGPYNCSPYDLRCAPLGETGPCAPLVNPLCGPVTDGPGCAPDMNCAPLTVDPVDPLIRRRDDEGS